MTRGLILGLSVVGSLIALGVIGVVVLLNTGTISVISNLSSGVNEDSVTVRQKVGYVGAISAEGAVGALIEAGLDPDSHRSPPNLVIPGGTKVKVIIAHENGAQVVILDGNEKDMKPWIHWYDLN